MEFFQRDEKASVTQLYIFTDDVEMGPLLRKIHSFCHLATESLQQESEAVVCRQSNLPFTLLSPEAIYLG